MKEGWIVEQGSHAELLRQAGEYKKLWEEQLKKEIKGALQRGKVDVYIQLEKAAEDKERLQLDKHVWENVKSIIEAGTPPDLYRNKRVLVLTPDATRTCPLPMMMRAIRQVIGEQCAKLDFMVALGTHTPLPEKDLLELYGLSPHQRQEIFKRSEFFNHRWDQPTTFARIGQLEEKEVALIESISKWPETIERAPRKAPHRRRGGLWTIGHR